MIFNKNKATKTDLSFEADQLILACRVRLRNHRDHIDPLGELAQRHQVQSL